VEVTFSPTALSKRLKRETAIAGADGEEVVDGQD
jgi:hypothetical protein